MKWIAKRPFYRTKQLAGIVITGACKGASAQSPHPKEIHQGAYFELGKAATDAQWIKDNEDPSKPLLALLRYAGCIGDANDAEVVARVEADIATAQQREANMAKLDKSADAATVAGLFSNMLAIVQRQNAAAK